MRSLLRFAAPLALVVATAGCDPDGAAAPGTGETIEADRFVDTYVDLRVAALRSDSGVVAPQRRAEILRAHGVAEEDLLRFAEVHGTDIPFMRGVWDRVEAALDQARIQPDSTGSP